MAKNTNPALSVMTLPTEVRLLIYEQIASETISNAANCMMRINESTPDDWIPSWVHVVAFKDTLAVPAIMICCKQSFWEMESVMAKFQDLCFKIIPFHVSHPETLPRLNSRPSVSLPARITSASNIRNLHL